MDVSQWLEYTLYGNPVAAWLIALAITVGVFLVLWFIKTVVIRRLAKLAEHTKNKIDDFVVNLLRNRTKGLFLFIVSLLAGARYLHFTSGVDLFLAKLMISVVCLQGALWGTGIITYALSEMLERKKAEGDIGGIGAFTALGLVAKVGIWSIVILVVLDNFGIDITALVAGLGIGGVAVAMAMKGILSDLFASISIALDKPFVIGDYIVVGDQNGSVEHIGLKTTRVRALSGEQLIFSNNDLLESRIRNYKRMQKRRIVFSLGVTYQTPHEKLVKIPTIVREIFDHQDRATIDRVHFKTFGDSALIYEIVYHVAVPDYAVFMDIQEEVNLELVKKFEQEGLEFAYPTQTLFLEKGASFTESPS